MREEKVEEVVLLQADDDTNEEKQLVRKSLKGKSKQMTDVDTLNRARSLYITTDMSIPAIAEQLGISKHTLAKYCQSEKWSLLKQNPEFQDWSLEMVNEIYSRINFYNDSQKILHDLLLREEFQTPKDIKMIVEAYRAADERTVSLRLLRENGNKIGTNNQS